MATLPDVAVENLEWFYLDSTGQEFGPFPSETMRDWFTQGFFPIGEELLVRLPAWKHHLPLRMIYNEIQDAFRAPPRLNNQPGGCRGGPPGQVAPPLDAYGGFPPDRRDLDAMAGIPGAGGQPFAGCGAGCGYWMMPPGGPAPYPAPGGYGFPPAIRPGYAPGPPRPAYGGHPGLPQGLGAATGRFEGRIKSFNAKQGFGFIECPEAHAIFGRDVFLHKAQIGDLKVGTQVTYSVEMNKQGMPQARELTTLDGQTPGPSPANVAKGGGPGGGRGGKCGGGKGGGRRKGGKGGDDSGMGMGP